MNDERITSLVSELIAYDESLKEHEADLCVLVSHMLTERPSVTIDDMWKKNLRARVLSGHLRGVLSPYHKAERWGLRLIPIGMVTLLVLMLLPERTHYLPPEPVREAARENVSTETEPTMTDDWGVGGREAFVAEDTPPPFGGGVGGGMGGDMGSDPSAMGTAVTEGDRGDMAPKMMMDAQPPTPALFSILPQSPGPKVVVNEVTVTEAGFIVVYTYDRNGEETVFGVSPLIRAGTTTNLPIYTTSSINVEGSYFARLHIDNGNRLFTATEDTPLTDAYGNTITVEVVVTN
jgi:hypothetical protein